MRPRFQLPPEKNIPTSKKGVPPAVPTTAHTLPVGMMGRLREFNRRLGLRVGQYAFSPDVLATPNPSRAAEGEVGRWKGTNYDSLSSNKLTHFSDYLRRRALEMWFACLLLPKRSAVGATSLTCRARGGVDPTRRWAPCCPAGGSYI